MAYTNYTVQKSFWGKKIVDKNNEKYKLGKSPYKIKFNEDNTFMFYYKGEAITPSIVGFDVYSNGVIYATTVEGRYLYIDPLLGFVSPDFSYYDNNIIVDKDNNILLMDQHNYSTTPTGYKIPEERHSRYLPGRAEIRAVDENGKFGIVSTVTGKIVCPFIFDSIDIHYSYDTTDRDRHIKTYYDDKNFILFNTSGEIIMQGETKDLPRPVSGNGYFRSYDPKTNTSKVYSYNKKDDNLVEFGNYTDYVRSVFKINDNYYIVASDENKQCTLYDQNNKPYLENKYDEIYSKRIDSGHVYSSSKVDIIVIEKDGLYGIYIPETNQLIEPKYKEIDFDDCGRTKDGQYKFLVSDGKYWGVINGNNEVEVPFEYQNRVNYKSREKNENGNYLLEIKDKNGNVRYMSVFEENIIADSETTENINDYRARRNRRYQEEKQRKKQQESKTQKKTSRYTEDERIAAAVGASLITGSPIAGLIVNELMKD